MKMRHTLTGAKPEVYNDDDDDHHHHDRYAGLQKWNVAKCA